MLALYHRRIAASVVHTFPQDVLHSAFRRRFAAEEDLALAPQAGAPGAGARLHQAAPHTYRELSPAPSHRSRSPSACLHHDHVMICCAFVRGRGQSMLAGASFDELVASNKTSATASGDQSIIILTGGRNSLPPRWREGSSFSPAVASRTHTPNPDPDPDPHPHPRPSP